MRFNGKVAIVTGGLGSIGAATASLLASQGAKVLVADVVPDQPDILRKMASPGMELAYQAADVSRESDVKDMVDRAVALWGQLDIMVANAGVAGGGALASTTVKDWESVLSINLTGVFLCLKHAVKAMQGNGGGSIVTTASIMGLVATKGAASYATSKGALVNLTRSAALDYASDNIRVNAVCPGHLDTPTAIGGHAARAVPDDVLRSQYPLGRLAGARDIANAIAFLASEEAAFITGVSLPVDGGYTAQ